ncbi:MAG: HEAT repeat domain-containing protein [Gemmataceae bacterium]
MSRPLFVLATLALLQSPALADEPTEKLAKELVGMVRDPRLGVRERTEAARTLGKLGPQAAVVVPDLIAQLRRLRGGELEPLQEAVVETLAGIGSSSRVALPKLALLGNRWLDVEQAAKRATADILSASDTRDLNALMQQLGSRDPGTRLRAAKALGELKRDAVPALPALNIALADGDPDVRRAALVAVRRIQPDARPTKEMIQAYVIDFADPDDGVRLIAVRGLGRLGPAASEAIPEVEKLLADPDRDVRKAAADALTRLAAR